MHLAHLTVLELTQLVKECQIVRKQIAPDARIFHNPNAPILDPIVDPMNRDPNQSGNLRDAQGPRDFPWMRLMRLVQDAMR